MIKCISIFIFHSFICFCFLLEFLLCLNFFCLFFIHFYVAAAAALVSLFILDDVGNLFFDTTKIFFFLFRFSLFYSIFGRFHSIMQNNHNEIARSLCSTIFESFQYGPDYMFDTACKTIFHTIFIMLFIFAAFKIESYSMKNLSCYPAKIFYLNFIISCLSNIQVHWDLWVLSKIKKSSHNSHKSPTSKSTK